VVLNLIARLSGFSLWRLLVHIKDELLIVLGTSSSESVLPRLIDKLEQFGCNRAVVGWWCRRSTPSILMARRSTCRWRPCFIAQAYGIHMPIAQQLAVLAVLMITSKGAAGVTGSGFVVLASTLAATHSVPGRGSCTPPWRGSFHERGTEHHQCDRQRRGHVVISISDRKYHPANHLQRTRSRGAVMIRVVMGRLALAVLGGMAAGSWTPGVGQARPVHVVIETSLGIDRGKNSTRCMHRFP